MNNKSALKLAAMSMLALATLTPRFANCFAQGSLTPPGAPSPTMKTLDQIEPRRPISSFPFFITEPGAYYLTTNATVAGSAIHLRSSNVTLDLSGFTITGDGGQADYAVLVDGTNQLTNVSVRNGKVADIGGAVSTGVKVDNLLVEDLQAVNTTRTGVWIASDCAGAVIRRNVFVNCYTPVQLVAFTNQTIRGVTISNNRISGSEGSSAGIRVNAQSGGTVRDVSVLNNQITDTAASCIEVSASPSGVVQRMLIDANHCTKSSGTFGISVPADAKATVIRNVLTGCTLFVSTTGNSVGPKLTTVGTLGTTGADISPWANFEN